MTMFRHGAALLLLMLCGCAGSLLAPPRPVVLYRLEGAATTPPIPQIAIEQRQSVHLTIGFASEIDGDRLLTVRGRRAMYLKSARWISPVPDLFRKGIEQAFARRAPLVMLYPVRPPANFGYRFELRIDHFEAVYADVATADAPPIVRLDGEARLLRRDGTEPLAVWALAAHARAKENSVGAIVEAFGVAADRCFDETADKTAGLIAGALRENGPAR
ncbi:hypothetical protein GG804_18320 [Sphingomonas histidinilytica]|uniref:ABC-type transport auxiliary lipoprotein family protein n=1 Tax=Rhizorhabdus histidinilytica TaxID=439228 RepID=UPI001AD976CC|nr:ABC-type transport auxiliary lipoprotein family protein [Rhizorhabdus histidinilytica]MBO9378728.1 hypothetical protein [Rhizorhabdus histidinilytica]